MTTTSAVFDGGRANTAASWSLVGVLVVGVVGQFLTGELLWAGFAAVAAALAVAPAAATRRPTTVIPAELLAIAAVPVAATALDAPRVATQASTYLAVAALALVFTLELTAFTPVEMPPRVAVPFVVLAAMAVAGVWTVVRWLSDAYLGTAFLPGVNAALWDLAVATGAAMVAGPVFALYFREDDPGLGGAISR
jgi:hypothetical protein